jgi:hypothetical protein
MGLSRERELSAVAVFEGRFRWVGVKDLGARSYWVSFEV